MILEKFSGRETSFKPSFCLEHLLAGYKCLPFSVSDPARGYGLLEYGGMSVGKYSYCAFVLGDLCSLQSWVPLWHATFLKAASEVAAHSPLARLVGTFM